MPRKKYRAFSTRKVYVEEKENIDCCGPRPHIHYLPNPYFSSLFTTVHEKKNRETVNAAHWNTQWYTCRGYKTEFYWVRYYQCCGSITFWTDPDPRIHFTLTYSLQNRIQLWVLLFSLVADKMPTNSFFPKVFFVYYFWRVHLHQFS